MKYIIKAVQVKPFTRTRKGKMEQVKGFTREQEKKSTEDLVGKVLTQEQDQMQVRHKALKKEAIERRIMTPGDVKTVHDVDIYRYQKAYKHGEKSIPSHYETLKELYGEKDADKVMREQEVKSWKLGEPFTTEGEPKKHPPSIKSKLIEGLMLGIAEGMEEALKDVKGVDEKILRDAVQEVKSNIMENLGVALKKLQATESEESEPQITFGGKVVHEPKGYAKQYQEKLIARKKEAEHFKKSVEGKAIKFIVDNPFPPDKKIHDLSDRMKIETDELEAKIYGILSDLIEHGKGVKPNLRELSMGIKIESEHTKYPELARWIALAHLKEIPDYYTRLKKLEKEAKSGSKS